jgi:hypothetical protein
LGQISADFDGRPISSAGTPTIAAAAAAAAVNGVAISGDDLNGVATVTTGTTGAAGALATVSFADAFTTAPKCVVVSRQDTVADATLPVVRSVATNNFVIGTPSTPGNASTYKIAYSVRA